MKKASLFNHLSLKKRAHVRKATLKLAKTTSFGASSVFVSQLRMSPNHFVCLLVGLFVSTATRYPQSTIAWPL